MALLTNCRNCKYLMYKLALNIAKVRCKSVIVEGDAVDAFTSLLVQEKTDKWGKLRLKSRILANTTPVIENKPTILQKTEQINKVTISERFQVALDGNDTGTILSLIETCKEESCFPVDTVSQNLLLFLAQTGNVEAIETMRSLSLKYNPTFLRIQADFKSYLAEAVWLKGNVPKALILFRDAYKFNPLQRRRVRWNLRCLFMDAANNHSEAVMVALLKFSEDFTKEFTDYSVLASLWRACFLSEWFSNQTIALELLEKHELLLESVIQEIPLVVAESLKYHKTDAVYRLVELLLRFKCEMQYSIVLVALFEYKYKQRDLSSCLQILHWCSLNNVRLPAIQDKLLKTILNIDRLPTKKLKEPKLNYTLQF